MRIGFLIPDDHPHHVAHAAPVANRLAALHPDWLIYILTTGQRAGAEAERLLATGQTAPTHIRLAPRSGATDPQALMREDDVLPWLDAVVVTTPDGAAIRARYRIAGQKILFLSPGPAGDTGRPAAGWAVFDRILVAGDTSRARLLEQGAADAGRIAIVGCPKFDTPVGRVPDHLTGHGRTTILYSPHHSPDLSSWHRWGRAILDWFLDHDGYQLIFAPHPRLFDRSFAWGRRRLLPYRLAPIDERHLGAPNIHIDLGSALSYSRAYTDIADIYIGDADGQLYEFLADPRPCGFLNAQGSGTGSADPRSHDWRAGHVIDDIGSFDDLMRIIQLWHRDVYRPVQRDMFAHGISTGQIPASHRAADAVAATASGA